MNREHETLNGPRRTQRTGYMHNRTFFNHDRWSAHDLVGELLGRGITQVTIALIGDDWTVSWVEAAPPSVIIDAEQTPP